jgi:hypothetical protein
MVGAFVQHKLQAKKRRKVYRSYMSNKAKEQEL